MISRYCVCTAGGRAAPSIYCEQCRDDNGTPTGRICVLSNVELAVHANRAKSAGVFEQEKEFDDEIRLRQKYKTLLLERK